MIRAGIHKSYLFFGFLALLAMLLMGCGPSSGSSSQLDANQVFIWPLIHVPSFNDLVLDPANVTDLYSSTVTNAIYGGLVTTDHNLNVVPNMATWDVSPDGRTYTFHLKPNLHFSDGTPLAAQDFAYSIDRALSPQVCVPFFGAGCTPYAANYLLKIKGAAARASGTLSTLIGTGLIVQDAQTLVIKLDPNQPPAAYFLEALTYPTSYPVESQLIKKYGSNFATHKDWTAHLDEGGDTGPFILKSHDDKQITLVPNPYWFGPKITLKEIDRPFVADPVDAYTAYRQGKYDYSEVPSQEYQAARDQADFHEVGLLTTLYVGMNQDFAPLNNLSLRQALALAINKQLIADRVLNGAAYPTNHIVPQGMPGFDDSLTAPGINSRTVTGDADTAKKFLTDFYTKNPQYGNKLSIQLTYTKNDTDTLRTAQALQAMWQTLPGVTITLTGITFQDLITAVFANTVGNHPGALQMWMLGWIADYPDPQDWLSLQFAKNSPNNAANYRDGGGFTAQAYMSQADQEQNPAKRMSLYNKAEQQLVDDVAWLPYVQSKGIWRLKTYIQGFNPSALDMLSDLDWANVKVLAH
jgi:peptide/nickel transport system substrate-binding protein/oligopeptide transport system substrate-binding protein